MLFVLTSGTEDKEVPPSVCFSLSLREAAVILPSPPSWSFVTPRVCIIQKLSIIMPSVVGVKGAVPQESSPPDSSSAGPLTSALNMVEKKVRNLEKRKGRLDAYRADSERGKELNSDQLSAIAKYDQVTHTLEFARELSGQFKGLLQEDERLKKKAAKRETAERTRSDARKIAQVLRLQGIISKAKSQDWEAACQQPPDTLKAMRELMSLLETPAAAETLHALIEGKPGKKLGEASYAQLREALNELEGSLAIDSPPEEELPQETAAPAVECVETEEEEEETVVGTENGEVPPQREDSPPPPAPISEPVVEENGQPPQQEFNFLQESQIDPINMDPAVVVVQHSPPQVFPSHIYAPVQPQQTNNTMPPFIPPSGAGNSYIVHPPAENAPSEPVERTFHPQQHHQHSNNHHSNAAAAPKPPSSKNPDQPTIEDWSEENEAPRENGGSSYRGGRGRGRGGYRGGSGPRKDNGGGYRGNGGRGGGRGNRSRGAMNGSEGRGGHYRGGEKEYRGRGRGSSRGGYRGGSSSFEKSTNGHRE